jgi:hypothetical protein
MLEGRPDVYICFSEYTMELMVGPVRWLLPDERDIKTKLYISYMPKVI